MRWQLTTRWDQCQGWRPLAATTAVLTRLTMVAYALANNDSKTLDHYLEKLGYVRQVGR